MNSFHCPEQKFSTIPATRFLPVVVQFKRSGLLFLFKTRERERERSYRHKTQKTSRLASLETTTVALICNNTGLRWKTQQDFYLNSIRTKILVSTSWAVFRTGDFCLKKETDLQTNKLFTRFKKTLGKTLLLGTQCWQTQACAATP